MSKIKKALSRAKAAREAQGQDVLVQAVPNVETIVDRATPDGRRMRKNLNVEYMQTKVLQLSPDVLRKNKLFSFFKNNRMTDYFDIVKGLLLKKLDQLEGNSIIITSAHPGEGKTFVSLNLGISIAREHDRSVLVVDTDFRHPWRRHRDFAYDFFQISPEKGLVHYLENDAVLSEIIINPGIEKMTIIPAGRIAPNSAELLSSPRMEFLIKELKAHYGNERIIIFDCPSTLSCVDALVFSHLVDGVLFVVESERTTGEELKKAVSLFKEKPILGAILNKSKSKVNTDNEG